MRRRLLWLLPILTLALPMAAFALASLDVSPARVDHDLRCTRTTASPERVTVTNDGDRDAENIRVRIVPAASAPVFPLSGSTEREVLAPGAALRFGVGFAPVVAGEVDAEVIVRYDAPRPSSEEDPDPAPREKETRIPVAGRGLDRYVDASPRTLYFDRVRVGRSAAARQITVFDDGGSPLRIERITVAGEDAGDFNVTPRRARTITEEQPLVLTVTFRPRAVGGRLAELVIETNGCGDPTLRVPLGGVGVEPEVSVDPPEIVFGVQEVGKRSQAKPLRILNVGGAALTITAIQIAGDPAGEFIARHIPRLPITLPFGEEVELSMRFHPLVTGERSAVLRVTSSDPDDRRIEVPLSGEGGEAEPVETPSPVAPPPDPVEPDPEPEEDTIPVGAYRDELAVGGLVAGFFLLLLVIRRVREIPD